MFRDNYKPSGIFRYVAPINFDYEFKIPKTEWTQIYVNTYASGERLIGLNSKEELIKGLLSGSFTTHINGYLELGFDCENFQDEWIRTFIAKRSP